jgi:dimethylaniline monooxygenase (N-oxide forming)
MAILLAYFSLMGWGSHSLGAIPPLSEFQAQLWVLSLLGRVPKSLPYADSYRLHTPPNSRIEYGVDHETYAYQLALDMGSAPSFLQVLQFGWKVALVWALGANFNTKFRLVGPWRWKGAATVMETELWTTITRRGEFFGTFILEPAFSDSPSLF